MNPSLQFTNEEKIGVILAFFVYTSLYKFIYITPYYANSIYYQISLTCQVRYGILSIQVYTNCMETPDSQPKEIVRVSVSEAARLFGVSTQTIRRAIKAQEITYVVVANRYKINFESLVKWSQEKTTVKNKSDKRGIGQYVDRWKISNTLYSPSAKSVRNNDTEETA